MKNLNSLFRKYLIAAIVFCVPGMVFAQVEKEVTLTSSLNLSDALSALGTDLNTITKLTVINNSDGAALSSADYTILHGMQALAELDLSADEITTNLTGSAFANNTTIETIKFPAKLSNIESGVFNSSALKGILSFPASLRSAPALVGRFANCQGITGFEFPDNTTITAEDGVVFVDGGKTLLKYPCGKPDTEYIVPEGVTKVQDQSFYYNHTLETLVLPSTLTTIQADATFRESTGFKEVLVADGNPKYASSFGILVDRTTKGMLYCPPAITEITIDGTLVETTPNYRFFGGAANVKRIVFTEGFTTISDNGIRLNASENLIEGSGALEEIYLPSTITNIGGNAFCRRGNVNMIVCHATTPPAYGGNAFFQVGNNTGDAIRIYVPAASLTAYTTYGGGSTWGAQSNTFTTENFVPFYAVTISNNDGTGSVESTIGTEIGFENGTVTITAPTAPEGQIFDKWEVSSTGTVIFADDDDTKSSTTITMPAAEVTLTATYKPDISVSIENAGSDVIKIYPNPATDYICVKGVDKGAYMIYDILGSAVCQGVLNGNGADVIFINNLSSGTYIIKTGEKAMRFIKK